MPVGGASLGTAGSLCREWDSVALGWRRAGRGRSRSALRCEPETVIVLLALGFLIELALLAAMSAVGARLASPVWLRRFLSVAFAAATGTLGGLLLSPNRHGQGPLSVRVVIELALFAVATVGLAWAGRLAWALVLAAGELAVLGGLWVRLRI